MPAPWLFRGVREGIVTSRWPSGHDAYFDDFPAAIGTRPGTPPPQSELSATCPTDAILAADGQARIDRGRCVLCGRCVARWPERFVAERGAGTSGSTRRQLIVPALPDTEEAVAAVRASLAGRVRRLRRSVHIRHIDAGSDGADEWEVQALANPVYDIHRLGIFFTASPRHADILLVTGLGSVGMRPALARTREAMPSPVVVIASGVDAASGGVFAGSYAGSDGIGALLDVDVWIPGNPASPFSLMHAILLALGRLPSGQEFPRSGTGQQAGVE